MADPKKINPKYIKSGELTIGTGYFNTGSFVNRPSVNGSGVLLVGEAAGGSNTDVTVTGSSVLSTADLTGVGNVTVTLDGNTVKISGASAGGGTPAGSDKQIQFNDGGSFGASANFTWDDNGLYSNGYISGVDITGASFHGPHFASTPYNIGNTGDAVIINFNNGSIQYATLTGNVSSFAASNAVAGEGVVVKFYTATTRTIAPGSNLSFLGQLPTELSAGMTGALSLLAFSSSDIMAGFVSQTGIG